MKAEVGGRRGLIERYRSYLPVSAATPVVSLGEGGTPLLFSPRLSALVGERLRGLGEI